MLKTLARPAGFLLTCIYLLLTGCASPKNLDDARSTVNDSQATLERFVRDPQMTWLQQNLPRAKAVLVSPNVWQAGFIVGGSGGKGIVMARGGPHGWSGPAFYKLGTGSIGLQAGAEKMEMVILVMNDKAYNSLMSSSFKLGGDVSIAAGPVGAGTGAGITADMVFYTRAKGLYGGINLSGMVVTVDDDGNAAFYGRPASPIDILVKHNTSNALAVSEQQAMARLETQAASSASKAR